MPLSRSQSPDLAEVLRAAIKNALFDVHTALPGKIEKYTASEQKADIKPLLSRTVVAQKGKKLSEKLPVITDVPILFPRGGGFFVSFPLQKGDHVLLVINERNIDKFVTGDGEETDPADLRMHDISGAVAIPGFYPFGKALASDDADTDDFVVGKEGGARIFIKDDEINLYEKSAAQFVALADKTNQRIADLEQALEDHKNNSYATHTHLDTYIAPLIPVGALTVVPVTPLPLPQPHPAGDSVAASKVKAT